ncbi:hypothetical protein IQ07DRAFT_439613 [Pyrenochaeta sp. DS3sAY3a]|nr:hypothetical protein IQ07DRAFT_439613 [Pyrenochaeta sp. DS3sAY3a]
MPLGYIQPTAMPTILFPRSCPRFVVTPDYSVLTDRGVKAKSGVDQLSVHRQIFGLQSRGSFSLSSIRYCEARAFVASSNIHIIRPHYRSSGQDGVPASGRSLPLAFRATCVHDSLATSSDAEIVASRNKVQGEVNPSARKNLSSLVPGHSGTKVTNLETKPATPHAGTDFHVADRQEKQALQVLLKHSVCALNVAPFERTLATISRLHGCRVMAHVTVQDVFHSCCG